MNRELAVDERAPSRLLAWVDFWAKEESVSLQLGGRDPLGQLGGFWGCSAGLLVGTQLAGSSDRKRT